MTMQAFRRASIRVAAVFAGALACSACSLFRAHIKDVEFVELEPFTAEIIYDAERSAWIARNPDVLRLKFSTSTNLSDLYRRKGAGGAYVNVSLCPFTADPDVWFGDIYHAGQPVYAGPETIETEKPYVYETFIRYANQWRDVIDKFGGHGGEEFPLPAVPQDLCFRIQGSGWPGFDSNVVVIPKDQLIAALHMLPKR